MAQKRACKTITDKKEKRLKSTGPPLFSPFPICTQRFQGFFDIGETISKAWISKIQHNSY